jgi:hypothetical protein
MLSLGDTATQLTVCKTLALAFPAFHRKTGISAKLSFSYDTKEENLEIALGFLPHEPTEEQYNILFEEIIDAEKLLLNEYVMNTAPNYETIGQLIFKHREETNQIVARHKKELE